MRVVPLNHRPQPAALARWGGLALLVLVCLGAEGLGAALTALSVSDWYPALHKPTWTPPDWLFGPVWTALYVAMAVAAWLVWQRRGLAGGRWPFGLFAVQLALNVAWSGLFFGLCSPGLAFAEILLLWLAIAATAVAFYRASAVAAGLLLPYLAWVTFAAALNGAIWEMNR